MRYKKMIQTKYMGVLNSFFHLAFDLVPLALWQVSPRAPGHGAVPGTGELVVMLPGPLGHQVGVVGGGGVGHDPGTTTVQVAQVVRQHLGGVVQLI